MVFVERLAANILPELIGKTDIKPDDFFDVFCGITGFWYYDSNLKEQYKYHKSLEQFFDAEINGEIIHVKASPEYNDLYTGYNSFGRVSSVLNLSSLAMSSALPGPSFLVGAAAKIAYVMSSVKQISYWFSDNYSDYKFTNLETGEELDISHVKIIHTESIEHCI